MYLKYLFTHRWFASHSMYLMYLFTKGHYLNYVNVLKILCVTQGKVFEVLPIALTNFLFSKEHINILCTNLTIKFTNKNLKMIVIIDSLSLQELILYSWL